MPTECDQLILRLKQVLPGIDANKSPLAALMGRLILLLDARLTELESDSGTTISGPAI
jgi:hypothetical protein